MHATTAQQTNATIVQVHGRRRGVASARTQRHGQDADARRLREISLGVIGNRGVTVRLYARLQQSSHVVKLNVDAQRDPREVPRVHGIQWSRHRNFNDDVLAARRRRNGVHTVNVHRIQTKQLVRSTRVQVILGKGAVHRHHQIPDQTHQIEHEKLVATQIENLTHAAELARFVRT